MIICIISITAEALFCRGPDFHYENKMRFEAFKEAMADYDIPLTDDMYMFGDFDFGTGVRYIKEWHDKKYPLPGAFVCANDNILCRMCSMATKLGYKIPQDFMVTGFDNLDKAAYYNPQITTVEHNRGNIGKTAIKILSDLWAGKEVKMIISLSQRLFRQKVRVPEHREGGLQKLH